MTNVAQLRVEINGQPADTAALAQAALVNYGHFTTMRVVDGAVRGLGLHLQRLADATRELFGTELDLPAVRGWMRRIGAVSDGTLSMRVTVYSSAFDREHPAMPVDTDVLISVVPARPAALPAPRRIISAMHQRISPHIKHVGTFDLLHLRRMAQLRGADDVVFSSADGTVGEGSFWNIGFFDDRGVVWPQAPMLAGVSMQLLQRGLAQSGVASVQRRVGLDEVAGFRGAFLCNSHRPVVPIERIDAIALDVDRGRIEQLQQCYDAQPAEPL